MASPPDGHEFEHTPGDGEGQGSLVHCSAWGHKESDTTLGLNNKEKDKYAQYHLPCGLKKKQTQRNREEKSSYQGQYTKIDKIPLCYTHA